MSKKYLNYTSNSFSFDTAIYEIEQRAKHSIQSRVNPRVEPTASNQIQKTCLNTSFYIWIYLELQDAKKWSDIGHASQIWQTSYRKTSSFAQCPDKVVH